MTSRQQLLERTFSVEVVENGNSNRGNDAGEFGSSYLFLRELRPILFTAF